MKRVYNFLLVFGAFVVLGVLLGALLRESIQARSLGVAFIASPTFTEIPTTSLPTQPTSTATSYFQPYSSSPSPTPFQPITHTPTDTPTPTVTLTPSPTDTPLPTATPLPTNTPEIPSSAAIQGISGRQPAYNLDCETRSAVDWAAYFGVPIDEATFFSRLPSSDNPNLGFVGNVHGAWGQIPPRDYGVYAKPVAQLLRAYGLEADAVHGFSWRGLQAEIASGEPVIVWVVGRVARGTPVAYTSSDGQQTTVVRFQHTVILTGYDQHNVTVLDGDWVYRRSIQDFLDSWGVLGNMAVIWDD